MRFLRRQRLTRRAERLLRAAGVDRKSIEEVTDDAVCRQVAFRVARREAGGMAATPAVAEELLAEEANYDFVMMLLEDVRPLPGLQPRTAWLSPRGQAVPARGLMIELCALVVSVESW